MTVIVLTACPEGLRGQLTRWLLEVAPGVFVGHVSARVRALLWERVVELIGRGRGLMIYSARCEQRLAFEVCGHDWVPTDFDGIRLMMRPPKVPLRPGDGAVPDHWSIASRRRKFTGRGPRPPG